MRKRVQAPSATRGQVVRRRREVRGLLELRHRVESPVEREAPAVVTAAELLLVTGAFDDERPAMRAHVRDAVDLVLLISRQQKRLVERTREQRERMDLPRDLHQIVVTGVVPRAREEPIALKPEDLGIGVHARGQGSRHADVGVDLEQRIAHRGRC